MDVSAVLDGFRQETAGCDLAVFADLGTGMVLCTSSAVRRAQEELDSLSATAAVVLSETMSDNVAGVIGVDDPLTALTVTAVDARIYLRTPALPNEALICVCGAGADLTQVVDRGHAALKRIAEAAS